MRHITATVALKCFVGTSILTSAFFVQASEIYSAEVKSNNLGHPLTYNVYLPTGYETNPNIKYPVLYLLHGNAGNRNEWVVKGKMKETVDDLINKGEIPPVIVIMPDANTNWYVDLKEKMETAFFNDLIPHVETTYHTINTRDGRFIAGLSMGGYGALHYVMKYPEKFQAAALLSPAIYNPEPPETSSARFVKVFAQPNTNGVYNSDIWKANNYPVYFDSFLKKGIKVPMYINSGDDDDFNIESEATRFYELLRTNKQPAELRIVDGKHEWPVWQSTLGDSLKYIFKDAQYPELPTKNK